MSFFSKFAKGTRSRFSKRTDSTATGLPTSVPEPIVPPRAKPEPAMEHDSKATADRTLDETLVPPEVPVRDHLKKPEVKAQEGQSSTEPHTTSDPIGQESIYQILWRPEAAYRMIAEQNPDTNTYVPSSIPLFSLLEAAEQRINVTKHMSEHEPNYVPYAVKVYYAYMYYIQILRARREAGVIDGFENSLLKRFEVKYPMTSLPCAEIVYPYFNTIISTELAEMKYDWIVPRIAIAYPALPTTGAIRDSNMHLFTTDNGAAFFQPMVPHMVAMLNSFIQYAPANLPTAILDSDTFIPAQADTANHGAMSIFGVTIHSDDDDHTGLKPLLSTPGLNSPVQFGNQNYAHAARQASRSDFGRDINLVVNNTNSNRRASTVTRHNAKNLDAFLLMEKDSTLRFFSFLRSQAIIHARFFDKVFHFSDVQTTGGLETTVLTQLKRHGQGRTYDILYADTHVGVGQEVTWYNNPFSRLQAGFATNRAGVRRNEELQALALGTNATLPITGLNTVNHLRQGEFWENTEWIQTLFYDRSNTAMTRTGKPMYADHSSSVLRCFREKPHGTGVVDNEHD